MYRTNVYSFLGALTCALLLLSCQQTNKTERGTDNTTKKEETKDVIKTIRQPVKYSGAFYQITNMGSLDIVFTQGPYNIEVEGPEDEIDKLNIGIDQYVLTVNMKNEEKIDLTQYKTTNHKVTLYVSCPIIKTIALCGTGNFHAVGTIQSDGLQLGIIGTGSIDADTINAERLSLDVTGSGNTNLRQVNTKSTTELLLSGEGHTVCNINSVEGVSVNCNSKCQIDLCGNTKLLYIYTSDKANCNVKFNADQLVVDAMDGNIYIKGHYKTKSLNKRGSAKIFQS